LIVDLRIYFFTLSDSAVTAVTLFGILSISCYEAFQHFFDGLQKSVGRLRKKRGCNRYKKDIIQGNNYVKSDKIQRNNPESLYNIIMKNFAIF
jgi:hypothetical protein